MPETGDGKALVIYNSNFSNIGLLGGVSPYLYKSYDGQTA